MRLKTFLKQKNYLSASFETTPTNHLGITAKINGITGQFLIDTGASNTCVGMDRIEYFKLVSEASDIRAAGAGASNMDTLISMKNQIEIGDWKLTGVHIVVFDLSHVNTALSEHGVPTVDGIIGAELLQKGKAVIDYGTKTLYLK